MNELNWVEQIPNVVGPHYWLLLIFVLIMIVKHVRQKNRRWSGVLAVILLFAYWPVVRGMELEKLATQYQRAKAHFEMRCRNAGVTIRRTVEDVEGIFLMKLRPEFSLANMANQYWMGDPYGSEVGGDGYIEHFLGYVNVEGIPTDAKTAWGGYQYVDAVDPADGRRYRYTARLEREYPQPRYDRVEAAGPAPRYGITWEDISTPDDRKVWVAGGSLKVIDLYTDEVIAERIGYLFDPGQGQGIAGGRRSPWGLARHHNACPVIEPPVVVQARPFVERVLKHHKGEKIDE